MSGNVAALEVVVLEHRMMRSLQQVLAKLSEMPPPLGKRIAERTRSVRRKAEPKRR
jgi:hypothetical protein